MNAVVSDTGKLSSHIKYTNDTANKGYITGESVSDKRFEVIRSRKPYTESAKPVIHNTRQYHSSSFATDIRNLEVRPKVEEKC